jgi:hypothetical protein
MPEGSIPGPRRWQRLAARRTRGRHADRRRGADILRDGGGGGGADTLHAVDGVRGMT